MAQARLSEINARIQRKISPHVELVRGEGYYYFSFDDGVRYDTESVMVPYIYLMPAEEWLQRAADFAAKFNKED